MFKYVLIVALCVGLVACGNNKDNETKNAPSKNTTAAKWVPLQRGLQYQITKQGTGTQTVKTTDTITVHYRGWLENGKEFDSSRKPNRAPFKFSMKGGVIQGWLVGIKGMKIGETRILKIPPALGYGRSGTGPIPPNSTLYFEVELLGIR